MTDTPNYGLPLPEGGHTLAVDVLRIITALSAIDTALATQAALIAGKASLDGSVFTNPQANTQPTSDNSTKIATTAFVKAALAALAGTAPATLDTLNELATALGNDPNFATTMVTALAAKADAAAMTTSLAGKIDKAGGTVNADPTVPLGVASKQFVESTVNLLLPPSAIAYFYRTTAPTGWLKANGANVSRATYSNLWNAMGSPNTGDGSTTFTLPDLRSEFVRGLDDGRGVDAGRTLGSAQGHQFEDHTHLVGFAQASVAVGTAETLRNFSGSPGQYQAGPANSGSRGTETRPRNIALLACIKH